jgi:hypothetical protein
MKRALARLAASSLLVSTFLPCVTLRDRASNDRYGRSRCGCCTLVLHFDGLTPECRPRASTNGEMEMRRHARTTPPADRVIGWLYWLMSGYGLRALHSLAALAIFGLIITTGLAGWGLAAADLVTAPPSTWPVPSPPPHTSAPR